MKQKNLSKIVLGFLAFSFFTTNLIFKPAESKANPVEGPISIELVANRDSTISECNVFENTGTSPNLEVKSDFQCFIPSSESNDPPSDNKRVAIGFDILNEIPFGSTIISAEMEIFANTLPSQQRIISIHKANSDWSETSINWSNQPAVFGATQSLLTPLSQDAMSFNLTSDVQGYLDNQENFGWMAIDASEGSAGNSTIFYSREGLVTNAPKLIVEYKIERPLILFTEPQSGIYNLTNSWPGTISGTTSSQNQVGVNSVELAIFDGAKYWNSVTQDWSETNPYWISVTINTNGDFLYPYIPNKDGEFAIFAKAINDQSIESDEVKIENIIYDVTVPSVPIASPMPGEFTEDQTVSLVSDGVIYYTLDGTAPNNTKAEYVAPINMAKTTTIRAIAYDEVGNESNEFFGEYIIKKPKQRAGGSSGVIQNNQESLVLGIETGEESETAGEDQVQEEALKKGGVRGVTEEPEANTENQNENNNVNWWWLLIIILAILGGLTGWRYTHSDSY